MEQSPVAKKDRVESSDHVDGAQEASPVIEATEEVADAPLEMAAEPSTTELLSEDGIEATSPLLWMMLSLSLYTSLRGWVLLNILGLQTV